MTGGRAVLQRLDGVQMDGTFSDGFVWQTNDGAGCTNESHEVVGTVTGLTRSDRPGETGVGFFNATLVHYRTMLFNRCYRLFSVGHGHVLDPDLATSNRPVRSQV